MDFTELLNSLIEKFLFCLTVFKKNLTDLSRLSLQTSPKFNLALKTLGGNLNFFFFIKKFFRVIYCKMITIIKNNGICKKYFDITYVWCCVAVKYIY